MSSTMLLKVLLPEGEVNINVDEKSTPGHLKENLKYSLQLPPKCITLTCDGRELDDIKPLTEAPNNLKEGSVVKATGDSSILDKEPEEKKAASPSLEKKPTVIKKDAEQPKKKKVKKEIVRPTVKKEDIVKTDVLKKGTQEWDIEGTTAKSKTRQVAFVRVEALDGTKTVFPEDDTDLVIGIGDPAVSPVWLHVVESLFIGEKAKFKIPAALADYDPEGLSPVSGGSSWSVELLNIVEVIDLDQDWKKLLHVAKPGKGDKPAELDRVQVHWRARRWGAEGTPCIGSSRERMAILPGYGIVPIEDENAPPVPMAVGEGQQEAMEAVAECLKPGGKGHLYLKTEAFPANRPAGPVVIDVELVAVDPSRGPGTREWQGLASLKEEQHHGDQWLERADQRRRQLETFDSMRKAASDEEKAAVADATAQVNKYGRNAERRYRRLLKWIEADKANPKSAGERSGTIIRLAQAVSLAHRAFPLPGEDAKLGNEEKAALQEARDLLKPEITAAEEAGNDDLVYNGLKVLLQVCIQTEDTTEGRALVEKLLKLRPEDDDLKNDKARLARMESAVELKAGAGEVEDVQKRLQAAVSGADKAAVGEALTQLEEIMSKDLVKYDIVKNLKVGKDVGNAMKMGDPDLAQQGRKVVAHIQRLAQKQDLMGA
jgi:hypothetical protein